MENEEGTGRETGLFLPRGSGKMSVRQYQRCEPEPKGIGLGMRRFRSHQHKDDKRGVGRQWGVPQGKCIREKEGQMEIDRQATGYASWDRKWVEEGRL